MHQRNVNAVCKSWWLYVCPKESFHFKKGNPLDYSTDPFSALYNSFSKTLQWHQCIRLVDGDLWRTAGSTNENQRRIQFSNEAPYAARFAIYVCCTRVGLCYWNNRNRGESIIFDSYVYFRTIYTTFYSDSKGSNRPISSKTPSSRPKKIVLLQSLVLYLGD